MKTSNFWRVPRGDHNYVGVNIAAYPPKWWVGRSCVWLAPPKAVIEAYKRDKNEEIYTMAYTEQVLNKINPKEAYEALSDLDVGETVLLCWEKPGDFCHRRLVAKWLEAAVGIKILEL